MSKAKQLDLDSDGGEEKLTINRKYAKKFEHNKSREEFQKLQSKYGDESDSDSEVEDETGELATADIENGISQVLNIIRSEPEKLKDKSLKFFPDISEEPTAPTKGKKQKPLTLKEYVLTQNNDDEEETYVEQQGRNKKELIDEINAMGDDDDDDDLLQRKAKQREIEPVTLPDPEKDANGFLEEFVSKKGWLDGHDYSEDGGNRNLAPMDSEDDEEFNDIAEKYESAFNFRYEDPRSAEIMSYARDQNTLRRKNDSARQKQREKKREQREEEESQRKKDLARLRKLKVQQVTDRLEQIKEVLGDNMITAEDLEGDWDNDEWDKRMKKLFDDDFYDNQDDFKPSGVEDLEKEFGTIEDEEDDDEEAQEKKYEKLTGSKTNKQHEEPVEQLHKLSKKDLKRKAQDFVDANEDLLVDEVSGSATFKYRTVEPESFGLSAEDILLADDRQLNMYVGLKKLASFRDKEKLAKDKKRYGKKKRLRQWRQEVWGSEEGPGAEAWEKLKRETQVKQPKHKNKKQKRK